MSWRQGPSSEAARANGCHPARVTVSFIPVAWRIAASALQRGLPAALATSLMPRASATLRKADRYTTGQRLAVAEQSVNQAPDAGVNARLRLRIVQTGKPSPEGRRTRFVYVFDDLHHVPTGPHTLQIASAVAGSCAWLTFGAIGLGRLPI